MLRAVARQTVQGAQACVALFAHVLLAQGVQRVLFVLVQFDVRTEPAAHVPQVRQSEASASGWNVPFGQSKHFSWPWAGEYFAAGHERHAVLPAPSFIGTLPDAQRRHAVALTPNGRNVPLGHGTPHVERPGAPAVCPPSHS